MDPLVMVGAWAGALMAIAGLLRGLYTLFLKAVRAAIREELSRMRTDQDHIEERLDALERTIHYLRQQVDALTLMMQAHVSKEQ